MSRQSRCEARTQAGGLCRSFALPGSPFCYSHDPAREGERRTARAKGGVASSKLRALRGRQPKLDNMAALVAFLGELLSDLWERRVPVEVGRCLIYGLSTQRTLLETSELQQRVEALERSVSGGR